MISLELRQISFLYRGDNPILEDVSLTLTPEDRIYLKGPNGSGKTTLFRIIMGLLKPRSGALLLDGDAISDERDWRRLRKEIGLVFQDPDDQLFCPTLLEDVAFGPLNMGVDRDEARERSFSTLRMLGLEKLADRPPYTLSGGQKKLGSIATVLSMSPSFILLDEPSAGLDDEATEIIIRALNDFGGGYMVASHEPDFLDRIAVSGVNINNRTLKRE